MSQIWFQMGQGDQIDLLWLYRPLPFFFFEIDQEGLLMLLVMSSHTQSFQVGNMILEFAQKFRLFELTEDKIEESAVLLARGFKMHNPIWDGLVKTQEEAYKYMLMKIAECLEWQKELKDQGAIPQQAFYNFICLDEDGKVAGVNLGFDCYHYKNRASKVKLSQFDILADFDQKSKTLVDPMHAVPGTAYYSHLGVVHQKYIGARLIEAFHFQMQRSLNNNGYKYQYTRLTNAKTIQHFLHYGGTSLMQISLQLGKKKLPVMFLKMDLTPSEIQEKMLQRQKLKAKL